MNLPISSWAIRNPIPVVVAFTLMLVAGAYSYSKLPIKQFPNISFPMVVATVIQEGAAPTELENQVTRIVENSIASLPNIELVQSSVTLGVSTTIIQFEIGVDLQKAKDDVESRVNQVRTELPATIQPPLVNALDFTGGALMTFAVSHPTMSATELSWFIDDRIARELQSVRGVGQTTRVGGVNREINVTLDPVRMSSLGVIAADVNNTLQRTYRNYGGGRAEVGGSETTTRVIGETLTVDELRNLTIPLRGGTSYVKLSDVAEVGDGSAEIRSFARLNGRPVAGFNIIKVDDASEVDVENGTLAAIARLEQANPGLKITKIFSMTDDTKANFHATEAVLIEGMILAALVVFLFLRDWRATVIAALAMPLSLIPTFFIISLFGFSLNVVTLLALTLVIGILVDDAIVEIENIQKRTLAGYTPFRAAMEGADAIGLAVLATTASIVVVFLPTSFMGGMPGQFFIEFGITVAVAVVFSLLVARFVSPLMAAYFLKPSPAKHENRDVRKLPGFYESTLAWALKHRLIASAFGGLSFVATIVFVGMLPKGFIPTEDPGYILFNISAPPGSTRGQMERSATALNDLLMKQPDVEDVFISIGSGGSGGSAAMAGGGGGGAGLTSGSATVVMREGHKMTTEQLKQHIRPQLKQIPDIRVTALMTGGGPGGSDVNVLLTSEDAAELDKVQLALLNEMKDLPQIQNPRLSPEPPGPELIIRPRTEEAARLNVSTDAIAQVARIATAGDIEANTPKFSEGERRLPIRVRLPDSVRNDLAELSQLRVPTLNGGSTTLGAVADLTYEAGPGNIQRIYRKRMASVQADFAPGNTSGDATEAIDKTKTMQAILAAEKSGTPGAVTRARVGNEQAEMQMFGGIVIALMAGVALIYSVMVLLFKSVFKPMVILASLPLSFSGAFLALLIAGKEISMPVMIGCVLLLGIAAKNAILLVEFAIEAQQRGKNTYDALFEACRERARPIVMTTVAMSAGMIPTALGIGEGAGFRQPMAIAVIGGLISSTVLSLVLVPVVYSFVDQFERFISPWAGRLATKPTAEDELLLNKGKHA
ncbi:MAG TPA: efflux RND transporter permease subunit, partial [Hyphomonadaceae bacterium]|nr:efflux RND transporter permease subunit [Hyphomonadaceae bacterium]